jgi:uncharacterized protein (TIGR02268 family)
VCQPTILVIAFAFLLGTAARAQPSLVRERRERTVTVTGNPAEPPHEIRAARGVATLLLFNSQINGSAVEVDRARVKILDAGERSIVFEPVIDLDPTERLVLSVPFTAGPRAVFVLVSRVSEVDTRIEVVRHEQTVEACQAELAATQALFAKSRPASFARAGLLTQYGVIARNIKRCSAKHLTAGGLTCRSGTAYRAETWALLDVVIENEAGQPPWVPREVTLKGTESGVPVTVLAVEMDAAQIAPGERRHVFVEVEPPGVGEEFTLELRDEAGRGVTIPEVSLSEKKGER